MNKIKRTHTQRNKLTQWSGGAVAEVLGSQLTSEFGSFSGNASRSGGGELTTVDKKVRMDKLMRPSELVGAPVAAKAELADKGRYEK